MRRGPGALCGASTRTTYDYMSEYESDIGSGGQCAQDDSDIESQLSLFDVVTNIPNLSEVAD